MDTYDFSITGKRHLTNNQDNQDYTLSFSNEDNEMIILADGVSACKKAREGAEIASNALKNLFMFFGDKLINDFNQSDRNQFIVSYIFIQLKNSADKDNIDVLEYASTLSGVLVEKRTGKVLSVNIGSNLILAVRDKKIRVIGQPIDTPFGTPVTVTSGIEEFTESRVYGLRGSHNDFFDENKDKELQYKFVTKKTIDDVIIFSDGAWKLLIENGELTQKAKDLIINKDYKELNKFFMSKNPEDDCSFVTLNVSKELNNSNSRNLKKNLIY